MKAYHGTPFPNLEVNGFQIDKIGTGEGAHDYGFGFYFTSSLGLAKSYSGESGGASVPRLYRLRGCDVEHRSAAHRACDLILSAGIRDAKRLAAELIMDCRNGCDWANKPIVYYEEMLSTINSVKKKSEITVRDGFVYEVELPEEYALADFNRAISDHPLPVRHAILDACSRAGIDVDITSQFHHVYSQLSSHLGGKDRASKCLCESGVAGLAYWSGWRAKDVKDFRNYVVWDVGVISNVRVYGAEHISLDVSA